MTENERKAASEKYYQELRGKLDERIRKDSRLNKISQKIRENAADFNDTAQYSELVSNHIAAVLQENVGEITSPLAKEYVCKELLKDQHSAINEVLGAVQVSIDEKNGIHIAPQKAAFPLERVMKVAHALEDPTVPPETIKRRAGAPVANVSKSFHDDYMKENAKFRNDAGLKCYITRMGTSCCPWCSKVAGRFRFGDQPDDIFRRHDNCDCTIIYDNQVLRGRSSADGGRTKTWEQIGDVPTDYQPTVFTQEQAKALEQRNLSQFKGLTNGENSGTIRVTGMFRKDGDDPMFEVTGKAIDSNPHEVEQMIEQLQKWGVSINQGSNTLGYGCVRNGEPGGMSVSENASYSAWCHEFQHAKDDMEAGWNGLKVLWTDPAERERRERNAYAVEINLAHKSGREDIVKRLEANLDAEIERIWKSYFEYFKD